MEEWQYQALRARAEQEGRSMSEVVREILHRALDQSPRRKGGLKAIEGIGEDVSGYGRAHDRLLYGDGDKD